MQVSFTNLKQQHQNVQNIATKCSQTTTRKAKLNSALATKLGILPSQLLDVTATLTELNRPLRKGHPPPIRRLPQLLVDVPSNLQISSISQFDT
jgi:hypothetical protein